VSVRSRGRGSGAERPGARTGGRRDDERGATLVEFALVAPLFFLLVFGIIEFGWAFGQNLDIRHGAREGARLVAVNYQPSTAVGTSQTDVIVAELCGRMEGVAGAKVSITTTGPAVGARATVELSAPLETLTGFLDSVLAGRTLSSKVDFRLEQAGTWAPTTDQLCPVIP